MTVPKIFSLLRPPLGGGADATRRARELGAPFRVAVALLVAALAFGAAMAGNFGDNPVFAQTTMDYDDDDDGLIDVRSLAQLNAVRHDLNGNGDATHADYVAAFPNRVTTANARMGCPTGTCTGYELRAHLDFDTDGDGSTYTGTGASASGDSGDAYYNSDNGWAPIGTNSSRFTATFKGNGYTVSNLFIKRTSSDWVGLFGSISGTARIESTGVSNAYVYADEYVGALVGGNRGTVAASWSDGAVRGTYYVGGLVGYTLNGAAGDTGAITASYSHASAHASRASGWAHVGGLTGLTHSAAGRTASVIASYAAGAVTGAPGATRVAGLTSTQGSSAITNSYYDSTTSGAAGSGAGHATTALQSPTGYSGIYSAWNVDVDGTTGNDDPWDFGTSGEYPALKYGGADPDLQRAGGDYDLDNDGLIEIATLAQLDAVRHDLDGNGDPASAGASAYNAAFPIRIKTAATRMGCPSGTCTGYELAAHLDFDTDGDGATYTGSGASAASDPGDAYHNNGNGWQQIAVWPNFYTATFKGNGFIISNLFIKRTGTSYLGMIGQLGAAGRVESVGLYNAFVHGQNFAGPLVGLNEGTVTTSWSSGAVRGAQFVGGLVGYNNTNSASKPSTIIASHSRAAVHSTSSTNAYAGGLTGSNSGFTGGTARIIASYSTGAVTAGTNNNRAGLSATSGTSSITASYWDSSTSGVADDADTNPPEGKTTADLKGETGYTGIYADWNVDVDGTTGNDDPWDFGGTGDYPALKYAGMDPAQQRGDYDNDDDGLIDVATLAQLDAIRYDLNGNGDSGHVVYAKAFPFRNTASASRMGCPSGTCAGYELVSDLDFDTDGDGSTYTGSGASATGDDDDAYYNGGAGWLPIGRDDLSVNRFATTFKGNGHVIYNLFIKRRDTSDIGLFGALYATARVESLGVANGYAYGNQGTGLVAGTNRGTVAACWSSGAARGKDIYVGGLVGFNFAGGGSPTEAGDIIASYSTASAHSEKANADAWVAGLAGVTNGTGGNTANIVASYSTGAVTAGTSATRVTGFANLSNTNVITASYWDTGTSGIADDGDSNMPEGEPTNDLKSPTGYTGIFANWNVNVDGVSGADDPWDFGTGSDYPALKYAGMDPHLQRGDYDRDNDGLIEIDNLAQLDAVRHDLNGNGDATNLPYAKAFPHRNTASGTRMGCPSGTCTGYELIADLDFDTDGDGAADSNFVPIGVDTNPGTRFAAVFKGNGHVISNLSINMASRGDIGLFGSTHNNARIESVGLKDVNVNGGTWTGALVGTHYGTIVASWSSGAVRGRALVGGLVGLSYRDTTNDPAVVIASYSHASVNAYGVTASNAIAGGLVGGLDGDGSSNALIIASYSTGTPSADTGTERAKVRGLSRALDSATIASSYYDKTASGFTNDPDGNGKTTAALQTPTGYTGIYENWNVDVDGAAGGDDPWDFGGASAYPRLKYGGMDPDDQLFGDYDLDGDGLIEIRALAQLDAVRHDLDGNGSFADDAPAATLAAYDAAFADRITASGTLMGCPSGTCAGYELAADLDFDTDGDGATYTGTGASAVGDSGDAYHNGGAGWLPIGAPSSNFNSTFKGNGYVISNLFIKRTSTSVVGLFRELASAARVESLGVENAYVSAQWYVGIIAGDNYGTIAASWSGGAVRGQVVVGGLVGSNLRTGPGHTGDIIACYSHASVHATFSSSPFAGGLAGAVRGYGSQNARIIASYSTGAVTAGGGSSIAGLTNSSGAATVANSYWDSSTSGVASTGSGAPQTTTALQTVASYTGIYENWNVNVDGVSGNDDPWHFGGNGEYPALKYDGMDTAKQRRIDYDRDGDGLIDISNLAQLDAVRRDLNGDGAVAAGADTTAYEAAFPDPDAPPEGRMGCRGGTCSGYELAANLDFDTDGDGSTYTVTGGVATSDSGDAYHNAGNGFEPIGGDGSVGARFNTTFKGNGYTISNLFIKRTNTDAVGLFGAINTTARIETMSVVDAYVYGRLYVGALVGVVRGPVTTSWVSGDVYANRYAGGLAGLMPNNGGGSITASYSRVNVARAAGVGSEMGGLLGEAGAATSVTASYSTGTITTTGGNRNGLIGAANASATITASYWDSTTTSITSTGPGAAQSTTDLQTPTGYTGIYANWDVDVDGVSGNDDPWHFGFSSSYPALKFGGMDPYVQYGGDYDTDDDGLIEIWNLDRLNAVRWDLDGDALQDTTTAADWKRHTAAFPGAIASLGCPDTTADADSDPGPCTGYELAGDLDFNDANWDGEVDPVRAYPNWTPIGSAANAFSAEFDGNNRKIANLKITASGASASIGLFGNSSGEVKRTGVSDAQISVTGGDSNTHIGALLGETSGDALGNWSTGTVTQTGGGTGGDVGGLIGYSSAGRTGASWSGATVTTDAARARAGGLGGRIGGEALVAVYATGAVTASGPESYAGGLLGEMEALTDGFISAYVTGPVAKTGSCGGANPLYGLASGLAANAVAGLYWNTETTGYPARPGFQQRGYASTALQAPTAYAATIYATWNADIDGDGVVDDPWDFGDMTAYPKLQWDGMNAADQTIAPTTRSAATAPPCAW